MSKSLTEKQKALIKDSFNENFEEYLENPDMYSVLWNLCYGMRRELRSLLYNSPLQVDGDFCKKRIAMFDRIMQGDYFNKEMSSE